MLQDFLGNERRVQRLRHAVATGQISHAYLITGPDQVGKRTLALGFAQLIQCQQRAGDGDLACGACLNCRKIAHGNHPDTRVLHLPADKQNYSIEQVREVIDEAARKPSESKRRIFIIPDVELFTLPAQQAALKLLEEPPANAMLILTCVSVEMLLPTVRSRCQEVALVPAPLDPAQLQTRFGCTHEQAVEVARLSGGLPGWACDALSRPEIMVERRQLLDTLVALGHATRAERIDAAGKLSDEREKARHALAVWLPWWRDVVFAANGVTEIIRYQDDRERIMAQARDCGPEGAEAMVRGLIKAMRELEQNANPRLTLEVLLQLLPLTNQR